MQSDCDSSPLLQRLTPVHASVTLVVAVISMVKNAEPMATDTTAVIYCKTHIVFISFHYFGGRRAGAGGGEWWCSG